jgi:hypothetical protein|tara:strand:+ start:47 stop:439 length:393 start_codon:yes stop_codon:yes gene_type:complete
MGIMDLIYQSIPNAIKGMPDFQRAIDPNTPVLPDKKGNPRTTQTRTFINPDATSEQDLFILAPTITMVDGKLKEFKKDEEARDFALSRGKGVGYITLPGVLSDGNPKLSPYAQMFPGLLSDYIAEQRGLR